MAALLILAVVSHSRHCPGWQRRRNIKLTQRHGDQDYLLRSRHDRRDTATLSLNGQIWVTGSQLLERLLYAALSGDRKRSRRQSGRHAGGWRRGARSAQLVLPNG